MSKYGESLASALLWSPLPIRCEKLNTTADTRQAHYLDIGHWILNYTSHNSTAFASEANLSGAVGINSWAT
jgi:hypothetical protein